MEWKSGSHLTKVVSNIFLIQKNRWRHPRQAKQKPGWNGWKIENTCSSDVQVQVKLFDFKKIPGAKLYNEDDTLRLQRSNQEPSSPKLERYYNIHMTSVKKCNTDVLRTPDVEWKGGSHLTNSVFTPGALPRQMFKTTSSNRWNYLIQTCTSDII